MTLATAPTGATRRILNSLRRWKGSIDPDDRPLFKAFVKETVKRIRGPFLALHGSREVLQRLEIAFQHARVRKPHEPKVALQVGPTKGVIALSIMDDQPFIVDTMRLFLSRAGAEYWSGFNLVFHATRDEEGKLLAVGDESAPAESLVLLESDGGDLVDDLPGAGQALRENLRLAQVVVRDFRPMTRAIERFVERLEARAEADVIHGDAARETSAFLKWLLRENFVFMGMELPEGEPLGIQTIPGPHAGSPDGDWPEPHAPGTVRVRKSLIESRVHRAGRIDEILVQIPGDESGQQLFIRGMFTYRAVTQPCRQVPILRRVLREILAAQSAEPGSFRYKGIANVFDSLPTEFLFTAPRDAIARTLDLVFESEQRQEVGATFLMTGPFSAFALIAMPKSSYSDELRRELERHTVNTLRATYSDHGLYMGRFDTVLLYFYLTGVHDPGPEGFAALEADLRDLATPWTARLWSALAERFDEAVADRLTETYGRAFPDPWVRQTPVERAVRDIEMLESLSGDRTMAADVYEDDAGVMTLRLYQHQDLYLSRILPILDAFGLVVIDSYATPVRSRGGSLHMDTFRIEKAEGVDRADFRRRAPLLIEAIEAVFRRALSSDPLNRLVLSAGLKWWEVDVLRAYLRYGRQLQLKLSEQRGIDIVISSPDLTAKVLDLFVARFDPDLRGDRSKKQAKALEAVNDALRLVRTHDKDLLFRSLRDAILATVRTNAFRTDRVGHYVSMKFECARVPLMPSPRPVYEIFVSSVDIEGVHLRFGKVARGGLRWSDRDDYRTEILGLATTQVVKNVLIVPTGSKGGFILKRPATDHAQRRAQADAQYQTFIRGLLDLTDNAVDGTIVPPPRVVRHDGDDPYLVVAADKGTAHLSDTANAISQAYGYWLGDAFASGGSNGYDHKKVGITARGAWVLVKRHFAEMGRDPYREPFTVVGIGDMSGDVFGNGLIESPHAKLLAAFNHLHVFLDPDPDPATSYEERKRLFQASRDGGWDHYDPKRISEGGGVYDRTAKSIPLSPQVRAMLGLDKEEAPPEEVIRHILRMDVDLLWNGGIGTYVKASFETHADADDRANDDVRIDATELRARVVGEGGNLGFTQAARIEANRRGVRLNTDFVDNSAGVDMSDHEVNLKILLSQVVGRGDMTMDERNALLEEMTEEVAGLVLGDNDQSGRQISRDVIRSRENIFEFGRAIEFITHTFGKTREELHLPTDAELAARRTAGDGLTRPEIATISAWVKMYVFQELVAAGRSALPTADDLLVAYFPKRIQERFPDEIRNHMLANEIAMTMAANRLVTDAGAAFFPMSAEKTGRPVVETARAYLVAQRLSRADEVRSSLEELRTSVQLTALNQAWVRLDAGTRQLATYWLGSRERIPRDDEVIDMIGTVDKIWDLQAADVAARNRGLVDDLLAADIPEGVATRVMKAAYLNDALMVWAEAKRAGKSLAATAVTQIAVGQATRLQAVLDDLATRASDGRWDPIALHILYNRFNRLLRDLLTTVEIADEADTVDALVPRLKDGPLRTVRAQVDALFAEDEQPSVATLLVLEERISGELRRRRHP